MRVSVVLGRPRGFLFECVRAGVSVTVRVGRWLISTASSLRPCLSTYWSQEDNCVPTPQCPKTALNLRYATEQQ